MFENVCLGFIEVRRTYIELEIMKFEELLFEQELNSGLDDFRPILCCFFETNGWVMLRRSFRVNVEIGKRFLPVESSFGYFGVFFCREDEIYNLSSF